MRVPLTEKEKMIRGAGLSFGLFAINRLFGIACVALPCITTLATGSFILMGRATPFSNLKKIESPARAVTSLAVSNIFFKRFFGLSINKDIENVINGVAIGFTALSLIKEMFCRMSRQ